MLCWSVLLALAAITGAAPPSINWQYSPPWQPLDGPCPGCVQARQPRTTNLRVPHEDLEPGVPTKLMPNGQSTIVKMAVERLRSPNSNVKLVYIPKGRLSSLANKGFARMVSSESNRDEPNIQMHTSESQNVNRQRFISSETIFTDKQKRDHRGQLISGGFSPSKSFPMTLVAARGNENTAREQLQLLEAALSSPRATESNNGQLPRVFIAPSNIPPPPGYVKIPLIPQKQAEEPNNKLPATFLTHNNPRPLPPGFVRLSLPSSVSHLSQDIPLVEAEAVSASALNNLIGNLSPIIDTRFPPGQKHVKNQGPPPPPLFDHRGVTQIETDAQLVNDKREASPQIFNPSHAKFKENGVIPSNFPNLGFVHHQNVKQDIDRPQNNINQQLNNGHFRSNERLNLDEPIRLIHNQDRQRHNSFENHRPIEQLVTNHFNPRGNVFETAQKFNIDNESTKTFEHQPPSHHKHRNTNSNFEVIHDQIENERHNINLNHHNQFKSEAIKLQLSNDVNQFFNPTISTERTRQQVSRETPNHRPRSFASQSIGLQTIPSSEKTQNKVKNKVNSEFNREFKPLPSSVDHDQILRIVKNSDFEIPSKSFKSSTKNINLQPRQQIASTTSVSIDIKENNQQRGIRVTSKGEPQLKERAQSTSRPLTNHFANDVFESSTRQNRPKATQFSSFNPINTFSSNAIPTIGTPANIPFPQRNNFENNFVSFSIPQTPRFKETNNEESNKDFVQVTETPRQPFNQFPSPLPPFQENDNPVFSFNSKNNHLRGHANIQVSGELGQNLNSQPSVNEQIPNHFSNSVRTPIVSTSQVPVTPRITTFSPRSTTPLPSSPNNFREHSVSRSPGIPRITTFSPFSVTPNLIPHSSIDNSKPPHLPSPFISFTTQNTIGSSRSSTSPRIFTSSSRPFLTSTEIPFVTTQFPFSSTSPSSSQGSVHGTTSSGISSLSNEDSVGPFKIQPFFNSFGVPKQFNKNAIESGFSSKNPPHIPRHQFEDISLPSLEPPKQIITSIKSPSPKLIPDFVTQQTDTFEIENEFTSIRNRIQSTTHKSRGFNTEGIKNNIKNQSPILSIENSVTSGNGKVIPSPHRITSPQAGSFKNTETLTKSEIIPIEQQEKSPKIRVTTFKPTFHFTNPNEVSTTTESQTTISSDITERTTLFPPFSVARRRQRLNKKDSKKGTDATEPTRKPHPFVFGRRIKPRPRSQTTSDQSVSGSTSKVNNSFRKTTIQQNSPKTRLNISNRFRNRGRSRSTSTTEATDIITIDVVEEIDTTDTPHSLIEHKTFVSEKPEQRGSALFKTPENGAQRTRPAGLRRRRPGSRKVPKWLRDRRRRLRNKLAIEASIGSDIVNDPPVNVIVDDVFSGAESARVTVTQSPDNVLFRDNANVRTQIVEHIQTKIEIPNENDTDNKIKVISNENDERPTSEKYDFTTESNIQVEDSATVLASVTSEAPDKHISERFKSRARGGSRYSGSAVPVALPETREARSQQWQRIRQRRTERVLTK